MTVLTLFSRDIKVNYYTFSYRMEDIHRAFFIKADRDGSGSLSFNEIKKVLQENGYSCDENELAVSRIY